MVIFYSNGNICHLTETFSMFLSLVYWSLADNYSELRLNSARPVNKAAVVPSLANSFLLIVERYRRVTSWHVVRTSWLPDKESHRDLGDNIVVNSAATSSAGTCFTFFFFFPLHDDSPGNPSACWDVWEETGRRPAALTLEIFMCWLLSALRSARWARTTRVQPINVSARPISHLHLRLSFPPAGFWFGRPELLPRNNGGCR